MKKNIFLFLATMLLFASCNNETPDRTILVTGVSLNEDNVSLYVDSTITLRATVKPSDADNQNVAWESDNTSVATVSNSGVVTAVANGTATIIVTTQDGGHRATAIVTVSTPTVSVTGVVLNHSAVTLYVGANEMLIATVAPTNATNQNVIWSSSNPAIATVDTNGRVTALTAGITTITAVTDDGSHSATCVITVTPMSVTGVTLDRSTLQIFLGEASETLTATVLPTNATNRNVTWSSNNSAVATVNANGVVTAVSVGTANITVTTEDGNFTATCIIEVATRPVIGVALNKTTTIINVGSNETFTAIIYPANATNQNVTWSSNNPTVATIANGIVTAVSVGNAIITVTTEDGGFTATTEIRTIPANSVLINDIVWATRNIEISGVFADSPENSGGLFSWSGRDVCPAGWRVPTEDEFSSLNSAGSTWVVLNDVNGRLFGTAPHQLFLPAAGRHSPFFGMGFVGTEGSYWSSTPSGLLGSLSSSLNFSNNNVSIINRNRAYGFSIRCVAE